MKNIVSIYNSTVEMARAMKNGEIQPPFRGKLLQSETGSAEWTMTESYEQADSLLINGDKESFSRMKKTSATAAAKRSGIDYKTRIRTGLHGFAPHVPNYLAGVPNNMINTERARVPNTKVLNIGYIICASCGISAATMAAAGARLLSYIVAIEQKGLRVNLYIISGGYTKVQTAVVITKVKDSGRYINPAKIAYSVINPSMHRRHGFRFIETAPGIDKSFVEGYGRPLDEQNAQIAMTGCGIKFDSLFSFSSMDDKMKYLIQ